MILKDTTVLGKSIQSNLLDNLLKILNSNIKILVKQQVEMPIELLAFWFHQISGIINVLMVFV